MVAEGSVEAGGAEGERLTARPHRGDICATATTGRRAIGHPPWPGVLSAKGMRPLGRHRQQAISAHRVAGGRGWARRGLSMTKDATFKKVVRRHAEQTRQRYTPEIGQAHR